MATQIDVTASKGGETYPDLQDHIAALDAEGLLLRIEKPVNKDTELHPLVRWQYRGGIPDADRKAFLFSNVYDSRGRTYDMPVLVGALAANRDVYRVGIGVSLDDIGPHWANAVNNPVDTVAVLEAPCQQIIIKGEDLMTEL